LSQSEGLRHHVSDGSAFREPDVSIRSGANAGIAEIASEGDWRFDSARRYPSHVGVLRDPQVAVRSAGYGERRIGQIVCVQHLPRRGHNSEEVLALGGNLRIGEPQVAVGSGGNLGVVITVWAEKARSHMRCVLRDLPAG